MSLFVVGLRFIKLFLYNFFPYLLVNKNIFKVHNNKDIKLFYHNLFNIFLKYVWYIS